MHQDSYYSIAVVSDTHGSWQRTVQELKKENTLTHLIFLGDYGDDGSMIAQELGIPAFIVRGNCDHTQTWPEEQIVSLGEWRLLIAHGHRYQVKQTLQNIYYRGMELGVDFVLYGHTHIAVYEPGDVTLINPGSMSEGNLLMKNASWGHLILPLERPKEKTENFFGKYEKKTCQT